MKVTIYNEQDAIYVSVSPLPVAYGKDLYDNRHLNFSKDGKIVGIEFLNVSKGIELEGISKDLRYQIDKFLANHNIKVLA